MKRRNSILSWVLVYVLVIGAILYGTGLGEKAVTAYHQSASLGKRVCVIIDPGHGGVDGGAVSKAGIKESDINLAISRRLNDLCNLLGIRTSMIRNSDISVYTEGTTIAAKKVSDLKARVRAVQQTEDGILLSIHQNYFPQEQYTGAQVFYNRNPDSKTLAEQIQDSFIMVLNQNSRRKATRSSRVYLLEKVTCPAVLVECGFLSNDMEAGLLANEDYQKKIGCVVATALSEFINSSYSTT